MPRTSYSCSLFYFSNAMRLFQLTQSRRSIREGASSYRQSLSLMPSMAITILEESASHSDASKGFEVEEENLVVQVWPVNETVVSLDSLMMRE